MDNKKREIEIRISKIENMLKKILAVPQLRNDADISDIILSVNKITNSVKRK